MVLLVVAHGVVTALIGGVGVAAGAQVGHPLGIVAYGVAFAVAGSFNLRLEFRQSQFTFTLADAVLAAAFLVLGPLGVAVAAGAGELVSLAHQRVSGVKILVNVTNRLAAATIGGTAFWVLTASDGSELHRWYATIAASLCFSLLDMASIAVVVAKVEESRFHEVFVRSAPTGVLTTIAAAPLGVVALDLWHHSVAAPLLLAPIIAAVAINARTGATHRDEHLRFERLYEASVRTAPLVDLDDAVRAIAGQARMLLTGTAGVCCATDHTGRWIGAIVSERGAARLSHDAVCALVSLGASGEAAEIVLPEHHALRSFADDAASVTVASAPFDRADGTVVAVFREGRAEGSATNRIQTLEAFAAHAALIVSNAALLAQRDSALRHQLDLNRQKSEFLAAVSHELRTPLAAILGSVGTLRRLDGRLSGAERDEMFDSTAAQGSRLQRLIEELLIVAAAEHTATVVESEAVRVGTLIDDIVADARVATGDRLQVRVAQPDPTVVLDPAKVRRVVLNLVENAAKYAPRGPIELDARADATMLEVVVRDHGPGIPPDARERAFERFVQLDQSATRTQGGTGLGLYLCRQLVELLGGELTLDDPPGGGCRFTMRLPTRRATVAEVDREAVRTSGVLARPRALGRRTAVGS
ncbi:MAG TPA: HAMP domain-containing sensor histidine kinase [Acidimicrobiia bacterium]|nr:HAMP domain-containing sensor histidine kinase [Acidimicrobiia bacterium]